MSRAVGPFIPKTPSHDSHLKSLDVGSKRFHLHCFPFCVSVKIYFGTWIGSREQKRDTRILVIGHLDSGTIGPENESLFSEMFTLWDSNAESLKMSVSSSFLFETFHQYNVTHRSRHKKRKQARSPQSCGTAWLEHRRKIWRELHTEVCSAVNIFVFFQHIKRTVQKSDSRLGQRQGQMTPSQVGDSVDRTMTAWNDIVSWCFFLAVSWFHNKEDIADSAYIHIELTLDVLPVNPTNCDSQLTENLKRMAQHFIFCTGKYNILWMYRVE